MITDGIITGKFQVPFFAIADGFVEDINDTIDVLKRAADLPLSIIIIGQLIVIAATVSSEMQQQESVLLISPT